MTIALVGYAEEGRTAAASAYEDAVLPLLDDHGAELVFRGVRAGTEDPALPHEVHVIRFPSRASYDAYLGDERRARLLDEHGEVFTGKVVVELDEVTG